MCWNPLLISLDILCQEIHKEIKVYMLLMGTGSVAKQTHYLTHGLHRLLNSGQNLEHAVIEIYCCLLVDILSRILCGRSKEKLKKYTREPKSMLQIYIQ